LSNKLSRLRKISKELQYGENNMVINFASALYNNSNWNRTPGTPYTFMAMANNIEHSNNPSTFWECRIIEVKENGKRVVILDFCCYMARPEAP
jgi:hypothetical protein